MASHQSPMIAIPKKSADEVDWTTPIRNLIAKSYGENPDSYTNECQSLHRCRQDAVKGAGSDMTGRDLLYKYFGQLELLELRFSEIRVNFSWHDAFTNKVTMQTSIAYEKASILFQIAATHSAIAAAQNRSDPDGLKLAFHYFRTCAGMLTYINENFLHAPSTDLSREVIKFLVGLILAQATEVFLEKCIQEKKANPLVAKIASQAAFMYSSLSEEVKDFMGKGIFDRNWVTLIQACPRPLLFRCPSHPASDKVQVVWLPRPVLPCPGRHQGRGPRRCPRALYPRRVARQRKQPFRPVLFRPLVTRLAHPASRRRVLHP